MLEPEGSLCSLEASDGEEVVQDSALVAYLKLAQDVNANIKRIPLVKVIMGNVTCDMDSAACTLAYAYLLHAEASNSVLLCDKPVLPVFNVDAVNMKLKTEVCYLLKKLQIPLDVIITRDNIDLAELAAEKKLELVLVDHHVLLPEDEILERFVVQVIDHRPLCRHWPVPRSLCTIEQVGSCASLIANKIMDRRPDLLSQDPQVPELLYGAILLDTMNFSPISKRFTELDIRMVSRIEPYILKEGESRLGRYKELLTARTNVQHFTAYECLMKDVKIGGGNPVCTLPMLVQEFAMRPDAESALLALMDSANYELIVLIGITDHDDLLRRDVGFFTINSDKLCAEVEKTLENACFLDLALEKIAESPIPRLDIYNQYNMEHTRKHILPVIELAVQSFKEDDTDSVSVSVSGSVDN